MRAAGSGRGAGGEPAGGGGRSSSRSGEGRAAGRKCGSFSLFFSFFFSSSEGFSLPTLVRSQAGGADWLGLLLRQSPALPAGTRASRIPAPLHRRGRNNGRLVLGTKAALRKRCCRGRGSSEKLLLRVHGSAARPD